MAILLPSLNSCLPRMTAGEKKVANTLLHLLEDDYLCWYDVPLGPRSLHPDFVILNPRRGLLILEVKDWKLETIHKIDRQQALLLTASGPKRAGNPLEQARQYSHVLAGLLQRDPALVQTEGPYKGQLRFAWGYGVVLSNITRRQFQATDLGEVLNPNQVICRDELAEQQDPEAFQARLWGLFSVRFDCLLSAPQIERVRWHLFPELRLQPSQASLFADSEDPAQLLAAIPDLIRVMDLQQEQLARNLGDGHRIIHGVAGSGKTMILGYRCLQLARSEGKPVLVLCFNKALAARLAQMMASHGVGERVSVQHFHGWCSEQLRLYQITPPRPGSADYVGQLVDKVIDGVARGQVPAGQYGAVLIDEGHDFQPEWFRLVVQMVDPASNSLLVLYDDAQSLYQRRKFSFSSVGIQARGRTTILRLNYRNTAEILHTAMAFAGEWLTAQDAEDDGVPLVPPESVGRHGPQPQWRDCASEVEELQAVAEFLRAQRQRLDSWSQLAVLGRTHQDNERILAYLSRTDIPVEQLGQKRTPISLAGDSVKLLTLHASKGLEFEAVAIPFIGRLPHPKAASLAEESRLLYVGMTRAMDHLLLTASQDSLFSQRLRQIHATPATPALEAACPLPVSPKPSGSPKPCASPRSAAAPWKMPSPAV